MPSQNPIAMMITRIIMTLGVKRKRRNSRNDGRLGITDGLWKSQLGQTSRSALQSQQHTSECGAQTICGNKLGINSFISCTNIARKSVHWNIHEHVLIWLFSAESSKKPMPQEPLQGLPLRNLDWKLLVMSTCASAKPMLDSAGFLSNSSWDRKSVV